MIHIATVHWKTDKWIDIQLNYLKKNIQSPFRVYAFLNDVPDNHEHKFYYCSTEPIVAHAIKLNLLAERISWEGQEEDMLIFIDGDAFPISDAITPFIHSKIGIHKLIAIQRAESLGDIQPHPSFCATTIGFWNKIKGDWKMGHLWKDATGLPVTDVGGNLLIKLEQHNTDWLPLYRSNKKNLHPLWFGVYANMIYHHGAGFREPYSRVDRVEGGFLINFIFKLIWLFKTMAVALERKYENSHKPIIKRNLETEEIVYEKIQEDELFYKTFINEGDNAV